MTPMKVREVHFQYIRGFDAPLRRIPFYDEETQLVRPLSVIVGANGSGKSTLFHIIEGLLSYALDIVEDCKITRELRAQGYAALNLEFGESAPAELSNGLWVALGRKDRAPGKYANLPNQICLIEQRGTPGQPFKKNGPRVALNRWVGRMVKGEIALSDGLLLFPHNRWIEHEQRGAIDPPPRENPWLFRFETASGWKGSLSQLWVWQNYLDLEARREDRSNLLPFIEPVERILGRGRRVVIQSGHVQIQDGKRSVELHQLPSGEQQVLALFGEIVRRLRRHSVILIDEIEISLHPALQRAVIAHLRTLAREYDLQVLVTTHSMEIVRSVSPHEVVNMDDTVVVEQQRGS
jgi:energy-coupling factor transporter ATP-binding protein EcfA2